MQLRKYMVSDCEQLAELFYQTVHSINAKDYSEEQLDAWASGKVNLQEWNKSFLEHNTIVTIENRKIVGFGDMDLCGYLDRLFVHKDYQRKGIGSLICEKLEQAVCERKITTYASMTARPFFERRGYHVVRQQEVIRNKIALTNFMMEKQMEYF